MPALSFLICGIFVVLGIGFLVGRKPISHYRGVWSRREVGIAFPILLGIWFIVLGVLGIVVGAFQL